jgi:hypothetical protein
MVTRLLLLLTVLTAGCTVSPAVAGNDHGSECKTNADCTTTIISPETCCDRCQPEAITRSADEANRARCGARKQQDKCPVLDCPNYGRQAAVCKERKCVLERVTTD